ncbi:hypothetical protein PG991_009621 [Apiospora marii]|uniref:Uncharacterized protein n=1 Tax=Apiospora marii TaxID=335849 RepID=A0ABR1RH80_9PEZI
MPYRLADRPEWVPDSQTLDALLSKRNRSSPSTEKIKALQELDDAERGHTGLVKLGKTNDKIEGDPFGVYYGWAGNVAHPTDEKMLRVMPEIFAKL